MRAFPEQVKVWNHVSQATEAVYKRSRSTSWYVMFMGSCIAYYAKLSYVHGYYEEMIALRARGSGKDGHL